LGNTNTAYRNGELGKTFLVSEVKQKGALSGTLTASQKLVMEDLSNFVTAQIQLQGEEGHGNQWGRWEEDPQRNKTD